MDDLTRRQALLSAPLLAGASVPPRREDPPANHDRDRIMAAGMTEAEAECWAAIADVAGKYFALPELHPLDKAEITTAIHVIQYRLLSRPTYRKYLEISKAAAEKAPPAEAKPD